MIERLWGIETGLIDDLSTLGKLHRQLDLTNLFEFVFKRDYLSLRALLGWESRPSQLSQLL